jgi:hypothetical protein
MVKIKNFLKTHYQCLISFFFFLLERNSNMTCNVAHDITLVWMPYGLLECYIDLKMPKLNMCNQVFMRINLASQK